MKLFLENLNKDPLYVIDTSISIDEYVSISLSSKNKELTFNIYSSNKWSEYLKGYLQRKNAKVAYGGYLEERNIYNRSKHFVKENLENQRNIHLGIDLWCEANTNVLAVLDGEIHSFKNNQNFGDYGPTIILKHQIEDKEFYSLYGHLSEESILKIRVGDTIKKGQIIAQLGDSSINGDYAPHLHFQLIIDIENNFGDYPGVSSKKDLNFYTKNCPNPNLLLKLQNEI